ncbi:MAG: hemerythrin [Candidatus Omnitrophota bacterium]|jgi:hemerythrin-like domain-containing protein|nr:MAG: hemerythrin [Candidatus Omnitrophota bacterium]
MKPTEQLKTEHRGVKLMLVILDKVCVEPDEINREHFTRILEFLKVFVDKCHHGKEEDLLLPAMVEAGVPKEEGAIKFTLLEHVEGRGYIKGMSEAFDKLKRCDRQASARIAENAKKYIALLVKHIEKEDNILFPLADKVLLQAKQAELEEEFEKLEVERIGLGKHEEFHVLLHQLKEIYLD